MTNKIKIHPKTNIYYTILQGYRLPFYQSLVYTHNTLQTSVLVLKTQVLVSRLGFTSLSLETRNRKLSNSWVAILSMRRWCGLNLVCLKMEVACAPEHCGNTRPVFEKCSVTDTRNEFITKQYVKIGFKKREFLFN